MVSCSIQRHEYLVLGAVAAQGRQGGHGRTKNQGPSVVVRSGVRTEARLPWAPLRVRGVVLRSMVTHTLVRPCSNGRGTSCSLEIRPSSEHMGRILLQ